MKLIIEPRRAGKTTQAIKIAAEDYSYVVCYNRNEADRVWRESLDLSCDIPHPITFDDLLKGRYYGRGIKGFVIDNADYVLQELCGRVELKAITLNKGER